MTMDDKNTILDWNEAACHTSKCEKFVLIFYMYFLFYFYIEKAKCI